MFRRRPFARMIVDALEKRGQDPFAIHGGDVGEKTRIVKACLNGVGGCSTYVALDGLDVGLQGAFDALTLDYFLRVRCEDRARVLR